jgi:hypothetical protein
MRGPSPVVIRVRLDATPYSTVALCRVGLPTCSWRAVAPSREDALASWTLHARGCHNYVGEVEGAAPALCGAPLAEGGVCDHPSRARAGGLCVRCGTRARKARAGAPAICGALLDEGGVCDRPATSLGRCGRCYTRARRAARRAALGVGVGVGVLVGLG